MDMPLQPGTVVPPFTLPDLHDVPLARASFRGRAGLLLLFLPPFDAETPAYLAELAAAVAAWPRDQVALVIARSRAELDQLAVGAAFRLLYDAEDAVRPRFLPAGAPGGWLVTDRYGELHAQGVAYSTAELPPAPTLSEWMQAVGMRCGG